MSPNKIFIIKIEFRSGIANFFAIFRLSRQSKQDMLPRLSSNEGSFWGGLSASVSEYGDSTSDIYESRIGENLKKHVTEQFFLGCRPSFAIFYLGTENEVRKW